MTFRARLLAAFLAIVIVPLAIVGVAIRRHVSDEVTAQYQQRVATLVAVIREDVARQNRMVAERLAAIAEAARTDNRFRQGVLQVGAVRSYVLDYAAQAMRQSGLSMLQIQDERGRIVSSGHFRNEYDLLEPALPALVAQTPEGLGLVRARTPEEPFLALARVDSIRLGSRRLTLVGGVRVDRAFLDALGSPEELVVTLVLPTDSAPTWTAAGDTVVASELTVPYVHTEVGGEGEQGTARIVVAQSLGPLHALRRALDFSFFLALVASALVAVLIAMWLASRISRPLVELAEKTSQVELDGLGVAFTSDRDDEIGSLTRFLGAMTERLRASVRTLKEVERRAAVGDLARQVNHDVKNGLIPIRNVFRHLATVARDEPDQLTAVFRERQRTVESAVEYLEKLAATYAGLYPKLELTACDVNAIVRSVVQATARPTHAEMRVKLAEHVPAVRGDELALRRVLENLVGNAIDSLAQDGGAVTVATETVQRDATSSTVRVTVADTGPGMTGEELDRAFGDFYSTKPTGTGLGLSIVKRLVTDLGGTLRVETEPGSGTRFFIDLPAVGGDA